MSEVDVAALREPLNLDQLPLIREWWDGYPDPDSLPHP